MVIIQKVSKIIWSTIKVSWIRRCSRNVKHTEFHGSQSTGSGEEEF